MKFFSVLKRKRASQSKSGGQGGHNNHDPRAGFTLIEIMTVIIISSIMAGLAIVYSRTGQTAISLSIEGSKISELILQAKELSVATYSTAAPGAPAVCGYGVDLNYTNQTYSIFQFVPGTVTCPTSASTITAGITAAQKVEYSPDLWNVPLADGVVLETSSTLYDVLFYPPDPTTLLSSNGTTFPSPPVTGYIYLTTASGNAASQISVTPAGQVAN
jgi:prepilin-type N-terminal cleavage/methylation domain-containing protein